MESGKIMTQSEFAGDYDDLRCRCCLSEVAPDEYDNIFDCYFKDIELSVVLNTVASIIIEQDDGKHLKVPSFEIYKDSTFQDFHSSFASLVKLQQSRPFVSAKSALQLTKDFCLTKLKWTVRIIMRTSNKSKIRKKFRMQEVQLLTTAKFKKTLTS